MQLPSLNTAYRWRREPYGTVLGSVAMPAAVQHLFTTRQLELRVRGEAAWEQLAASVGGTVHDLLRVKQVHGHTVRVVRRGDDIAAASAERPEADAVVCDAAGAILAVQVADCVPMLMVSLGRGAAAAVHAGWRGTCLGVGAAAVATLVRECGVDARDLHVALGPSIGACCYEVGDELMLAFRASGATESELARWFTRSVDGSLRLDLWSANCDQLVNAGVLRNRIYPSRLCTQTHAATFDSYRAEGPRAGRMIAAIRVPAPR